MTTSSAPGIRVREHVGGRPQTGVVLADEHGGRAADLTESLDHRRVLAQRVGERAERFRIHAGELRLDALHHHVRCREPGGFRLLHPELLDGREHRGHPLFPAELRERAEHVAELPGRRRTRVHEHQRAHALRIREHVAQRDDAAHRVPEQVERRRRNARVGEVREIRGQLIEGVRARVTGVGAVTVTALVVRDDAPRRGQRRDHIDEVERGAGESVEQQQRRLAAPLLVVPEDDVADGDFLAS